MVLVSAAVVFVCGCSTSDVNYRNAAAVRFERVPSEGVFITDVGAYEDGGEMVVYGKVKRAGNNCCDAVRGHVDIAVVAADGLVLDVVNVMYSPRNIPKTRSRKSRFTARLPYTLGKDVTLRMTYHDSREVAASSTYLAGKSLCEQNIEAHREEG